MFVYLHGKLEDKMNKCNNSCSIINYQLTGILKQNDPVFLIFVLSIDSSALHIEDVEMKSDNFIFFVWIC
jgi:hypothetical protein